MLAIRRFPQSCRLDLDGMCTHPGIDVICRNADNNRAALVGLSIIAELSTNFQGRQV